MDTQLWTMLVSFSSVAEAFHGFTAPAMEIVRLTEGTAETVWRSAFIDSTDQAIGFDAGKTEPRRSEVVDCGWRPTSETSSILILTHMVSESLPLCTMGILAAAK